MSTHEIFYHLYSATMSPCSLDHDERERAYRSWLCPGCNGPRSHGGTIDVRIQLGSILDKPMTFVAGGFPGLAFKEFLSQINPAILERDLRLGCVFQSDGNLLEDWATFRGRHRLIVRGTRNVSDRVCSDCGRHVYFAMGHRHLDPESPRDADVYESDLSGLIFTEAQFQQLSIAKWRKGLRIDKLSIRL